MDGERDFSDLPDVVWVKVMSMLELGDRNRLSRSCGSLNAVFHHPSLWHTVRIVLLADLEDGHHLPKSRLSHGVIMPERYTAMIQSFGGFFQNVELVILGYVSKIKKPCAEVITQLAMNCRLQSLTLEIGDPVNVATKRKPPSESDLAGIGMLVGQAFRLKSLAMTSWPIYLHHKGYDILKCLTQNEKIKELEKLRLFDSEADSETWFPRNTSLPSPEQIRQTVVHFCQLTSLGLHGDFLSDTLMLELSNLKRLSHLSVLLIQSSNTALAQIKGSSWKNLMEIHPTLRVSVTVGNTLPSYEFMQFLQREIPLSSISFSKYARYQPHILEHILASYCNTLTVFRDFGYGLVNGDVLVLALVTRSKGLNHFIYSAALTDSTVLTLAELRRQDWVEFKAKLHSHCLPENDNENEVIGVTSDGDFYIKAHQPNSEFYHTDNSEADRKATVETVINKVSMLLGKKWLPI